MPRHRVLSLRTLLGAAMIAVATLALMVAVTLVVLTAYLHDTSKTLGESFNSIRLAEEVEINLLVYERIDDPLVRRDLERDLRQKLREAGGLVTTHAESVALRDASESIERYLAAVKAVRRPKLDDMADLLEQADSSIDGLVDVNLAKSRAVEQRVAHWDQLAGALGIGVAILLLAFVGGVLWWLRSRAFQPVFDLGDAMERFGQGDRDARQPESGPAELREMARRFNEMATAIARNREVQMTFLAGVAHDLRTPLTALRLSAASIAPDRPLPSEEKVHRVLARVLRQVDRLDRMISDFLDTARIEAGQLDLKFVECNVGELVHHVVDLFSTSDLPHHIDVSTPPGFVAVRCDPLRIEQVLTNLVSNAIKYAPQGGRIGVSLQQSAGGVSIEVSDEGIGMSEEDQNRMFEPFRRSTAARQGFPGVGLGLFVAQRIVAAHGGTIEVTSHLNQGSAFRVWLPNVPKVSRETPPLQVSAA